MPVVCSLLFLSIFLFNMDVLRKQQRFTDTLDNEENEATNIEFPEHSMDIPEYSGEIAEVIEIPQTSTNQVRSRKRKINTQRLGLLAYLEQYDKQQAALKQKKLEIEERKLILEERKIQLMEKHHNLAEFQTKKQLELQEKKINFEKQSRENLEIIIERRYELINLLINKLS